MRPVNFNASWLTNDPEVAARLIAADRACARARDKAKSLPLIDKIAAIRQAEAERHATYDAVWCAWQSNRTPRAS